jgi:hypothetical protein
MNQKQWYSEIDVIGVEWATLMLLFGDSVNDLRLEAGGLVKLSRAVTRPTRLQNRA